MNKKTLFLITAILAFIVFISSLVDSEPGTLLGSVWIFRFGWLIMSFAAFMNYNRIKKSEKNPTK